MKFSLICGNAATEFTISIEKVVNRAKKKEIKVYVSLILVI